MANVTPQELARKVLRAEWGKLSAGEQRVVEAVLQRSNISRDSGAEGSDGTTFGAKLADRITKFGGSWTFIMIFIVFLVAWAAVNSLLLGRDRAFDPYPYILLNLFLSMLASLQAPIILMSQNRQAARDRQAAAHDYEVNLKAEIEIRHLHEKLDEIREKRWRELVEMQQEQIEYLKSLAGKK